MYNQSNAGNANHVADSKRPARKKKIGCLGCFGYSLLTILVLAVGLFAFNTIRSKIEEREQQKLEARFDYEEKFSAEEKLTRSFEKGEISADTYVLQLAYSLYDVEKLDPLYKSDNDVDFPPDVVNAVLEHEDELSDETLEYIASKILMTDIKIHPDASQNSVAYKNNWLPFSEYVFAEDEYDVTVLDKAILSPGGKFLIFYTETGKSAVKREVVQELAGSVEKIADDISDFLGIEWDYNFQVLNFESHIHMKKVLNACGIDENAIKKALPVYIYEPPETSGALAWYIRNFNPVEKFGNWLVKVASEENIIEERATVYSVPYIVVKTSSISNMENLNAILGHELTHHFQRIYYNNLNHNPPDFTNETVANFVSASINKNKGTNTVLNKHANDSMNVLDSHFYTMIDGKACGYLEFVWAKSYVDIIENGKQYLMESLLQEGNPFNFLKEKAGDSYQLVFEDFAVRNITKDYQEKGFISTIFPKPKEWINRYMDGEEHEINFNCLHYYYIDVKSFRKSKTEIRINSVGDAEFFIKVIGRKKEKYSLVDTIYCEPGKEFLFADFSKGDYKEYNEIILAFGNCDTTAKAKYQMICLSPATIALYEALTGLKDIDPWEINGDCITINVKDFMKGATTLTDLFARINPYIWAEVIDEDSPDVEEYVEHLQDEINEFGEALKKFGDMFDYKTVRIYVMPIKNSVLSDDEIHDTALKNMPIPRLKVIDKAEDGMHLSMGGSIQPFSKTRLIFYTVITKPDEKIMYRIELEK
ncbi:MAG TPA: hypothetical protein DEF39_06625 [Hungateiclostridium thermocellum]|uniref:Uncharacterized protein n=1 Tax=Acetivibrio thermocellus (strain ATCC 27405 / DSM 1237 / JCM 9322 / NBRC 103400 / NCIMB 10682 / NRRL B-4536 / VPI 7372) TaxID=203119 RepID=A3DCT8_ACET2|nr:hypothetical protein [Acetivibrio thermocellus]ABN51767.1 hypothetical protein Cthe_0531 [Acetivibrio thermocellus ATCC 27405]UWV45725.1 hypothetical protein N1236_09025 [Acetivibrio thermocellus]HBW26931.1 hypothetical protein [Acetivibrio thermocellus]